MTRPRLLRRAVPSSQRQSRFLLRCIPTQNGPLENRERYSHVERRNGLPIVHLPFTIPRLKHAADRGESMGGFDIFTIVVVLLAVITLYLAVKTLPQGYNWTVQPFSRCTRMLPPRLHLSVPFVDRAVRE